MSIVTKATWIVSNNDSYLVSSNQNLSQEEMGWRIPPTLNIFTYDTIWNHIHYKIFPKEFPLWFELNIFLFYCVFLLCFFLFLLSPDVCVCVCACVRCESRNKKLLESRKNWEDICMDIFIHLYIPSFKYNILLQMMKYYKNHYIIYVIINCGVNKIFKNTFLYKHMYVE